MSELRRTALHAVHQEAGARLVDFAGWEMPVWYSSATEEHLAVRADAGLFDLGHMGELFVSGADAAAMLDYALLVQASAMPVGRARYTMICAPDGGIIDDLIAYRITEDRFMVVANASNAAVVAAELGARADGFDVSVDDETDAWSLVAVQGPRSPEIVQSLTDVDLDTIRYYRIDQVTIADSAGLIARTGYTGEDGFELFVPSEASVALWRRIADGPNPPLLCGLAARDTLRLEAGMPLYGNELGLDTTPFDVGSARLVRLDRGDFVGRTALAAAAEASHLHLVGLHIDGRRPARAGYSVSSAGHVVGAITSGALSPSYERLIAIASVDRALEPGTAVSVDVRGTETSATVVGLPFHRRN